jgi:glycosyltransferase involved in cell wall biosynthesis
MKMKCPTLADLPSPPPGKQGWPWTQACPPLPETTPTGLAWPEISIVTPSFNQADYLEETIRSVLLQGYARLSYYVMDGGSRDGSVQVIERYAPWLAGWTSQPDGGQSNAINKGFARATGELMGWLNSDDVYEYGALQQVGEYFTRQPACRLMYGDGWYIDKDGKQTGRCDWIRPFERRAYLNSNFILQPAAFWRRSLWQEAGQLAPDLHWAMDWEWFLRATRLTIPHYLPVELARWRITPEIKTRAGGAARRAEIARISRRYGGFWQPTHLAYQVDRLAWWAETRAGKGRGRRALSFMITPLRWLLKKKLWGGNFQK